VINAAVAAVEAGMVTFLTVEEDAKDSRVVADAMEHPRLRALGREAPALFTMGVNTWVRFNEKHMVRRSPLHRAPIDVRCTQLFENLVVTPQGNVSACCGLPFEYIPELRSGSIADSDLGDLYRSQCDDFLKWWIHTEGPLAIVRVVAPHRAAELSQCDHICEVCATLYRDPELRDAVRTKFINHVPRVLSIARVRKQIEALGVADID
jgi:hypothetical protein